MAGIGFFQSSHQPLATSHYLDMSVLTAHKILISSALALFFGYTIWEFRNYTGGDGTALLRSVLAGVATAGLAVYLRWVWIHRPSDSSVR